ncbi:hypothetical protein B9Z19DRAFT_1085312 [Tuber borchii]|uniref:Emopamil-binding protein n=1 Tax=Tuber borchii TaxID=42251 RepID=A0A2T6ZR05_TUBBO|nr:hypothetical protein B9Z19DRAFT_1085312 [Tuber borchii]
MPTTYNPPKAITIWLLLSSLVVIYDATYILLRPYTFSPNILSRFWQGHNFYATVDHVYGASALAEKDGFPPRRSALNFIYLAKYFSTSGEAGRGGMLVVGFMGVVMTLAKTVLYMLVEVCSGGGINDLKTFVLFYILPNSFWIVFPGWCTYWFAKEIVKGIESGGEGKVKKRV